MSDIKEESRNSSSSENSRNEWIDGERPSSEVVTETISTSQMQPTNIEEDIIGYASAYADGKIDQASVEQNATYSSISQSYQTSMSTAGGTQGTPEGNAISTASMIEVDTDGPPITPVMHIGDIASGAAPRSHINPALADAFDHIPQLGNSLNNVVQQSSTTITTEHMQAADSSMVQPKLPVACQKEVDCCKYEINKDPNPIVVVKHPDKPIHYDQNIGVRYLKPPTPPPPGPIIVKEVRPAPMPEAPPLYVKLRPQRPPTPPPLIIREAPPAPPKPLPTQVIHKVLPPAPPPPRKVIVEKLPPLPPKPQQVIIEKWLPYERMKREIIYQRLPDLPPQEPVRNTLINWAPLKAEVTKRYHNLGVVRADPAAYSAQHALQMVGSQQAMNAMAQYGAQLHYQEAAGAHTSGDRVYIEDRAELDRLMRANFHPNDPICKQYIAAAAGGSQFGMTMPCPPPTLEDSQKACHEAQSMAVMYGAQFPPGHAVPSCPPGSGGFMPWMTSAYGVESEVVGPPPYHGAAGPPICHEVSGFQMESGPIPPGTGPDLPLPPIYHEVSQMYPEYCENADFIPPPPGPFLG